MSPHDYTWLLFASPLMVAAAGAAVFFITGWQDRRDAKRRQ